MIWMNWPYPAVRRDDAKVFFSFPHKHLCSILYLEYVLIFCAKCSLIAMMYLKDFTMC